MQITTDCQLSIFLTFCFGSLKPKHCWETGLKWELFTSCNLPCQADPKKKVNPSSALFSPTGLKRLTKWRANKLYTSVYICFATSVPLRLHTNLRLILHSFFTTYSRECRSVKCVESVSCRGQSAGSDGGSWALINQPGSHRDSHTAGKHDLAFWILCFQTTPIYYVYLALCSYLCNISYWVI